MVVVQHVQYCFLWSHSALQMKMKVVCNVMPFGLLNSSGELGALVIGKVSYPIRLHHHQHLANLNSSTVQVLIGSHT